MVLWGHGKKYDLLPLVFVVVSGSWQEVRFVASSFCGSVGAWQKYALLPLVFVVGSGHGKKYDLLLLVLRFCGGMARSTICCL